LASTLALRILTQLSPSVWALVTWLTSADVDLFGAAQEGFSRDRVRRLDADRCPVRPLVLPAAKRMRILSCATIVAPSLWKSALPPV
jgi:hypothetical protein